MLEEVRNWQRDMQDAEPGVGKKASRIRCANSITWRHPKDNSSYAHLQLPVGAQITVEAGVMDCQERRSTLTFFWTWPLRRADIAKALRQMGQVAMSIVLAMQGPNKYNVSAYTLANVLSVTAWEAKRWPSWLQQLHEEVANALIKEGGQHESWLQAIRECRWEKICMYENYDRWRIKGSNDLALTGKRPSMEPAEFRLMDPGESENESAWEQLEELAREKRGRGAWRGTPVGMEGIPQPQPHLPYRVVRPI